jgi:hypothetical protein
MARKEKRKPRRVKGKRFELVTARVVSGLRPGATVQHDVKIVGTMSKVGRQFDVRVAEPGSYDYLLLECKDHQRPVDVELVEGFGGKLRDVGGKRAAIVSNSGYTKAALNMADALGIDALMLVDTDDPTVQARIYATVLARDAYVEDTGLLVTPQLAGKVSTRFSQLRLFDRSGGERLASEVFTDVWNGRGIPHVAGSHDFTFADFGYVRYVRLDGTESDASELRVRVVVGERCWLGQLQVLSSEGLYDVRNEAYETAGMTLEPLEASRLPEWQPIDCKTAATLQVTLTQWMSTPLLLAQ